jgi:hypothetical protein
LANYADDDLRLRPWREVPAAIWGCHSGLKPSPYERGLKSPARIARGDACVVKSGETGDYAGKTMALGSYEPDFYIKPALAESVR